jgi:hypothetical protein
MPLAGSRSASGDVRLQLAARPDAGEETAVGGDDPGAVGAFDVRCRSRLDGQRDVGTPFRSAHVTILGLFLFGGDAR